VHSTAAAPTTPSAHTTTTSRAPELASVPLTSNRGAPTPTNAETKVALLARFAKAKTAACPGLAGFLATTDPASFCHSLKKLIALSSGTPKVKFYGSGATLNFWPRGYDTGVDLALTLNESHQWQARYYTGSYISATETLPTEAWREPMQKVVAAYRTGNCAMFSAYYLPTRTDHPTASFCQSLKDSHIAPYFVNDPTLTPAFQGGNSEQAFYAFRTPDGKIMTMVLVQETPKLDQPPHRYLLLGTYPSA
jgi:hypothetical protein